MFNSNKNEEISHKQADISDSDFSQHSAPTPCFLHCDTQQVGLVLGKGAEFKGSSFVSEFWSRVGFCSPGWQLKSERLETSGAWKLIQSQDREPGGGVELKCSLDENEEDEVRQVAADIPPQWHVS